MRLWQLEGVKPLLIFPGDVSRFVARVLRVGAEQVALQLTGPRSWRADVSLRGLGKLRKVVPFARREIKECAKAVVVFMAGIDQELEIVVR